MTEDEDESRATAPLVFLLGFLLFVGSLVAFVADLVTDHDVLRSLAANATGVVVLVSWAAYDTLTDPESSVANRSGAAGTGLLLFGLYLALAAVVVGVSSLRHGRLELAVWSGGLGLVFVIVGFLIYPREAIVEEVEGKAETDDKSTEDADDESVEDGDEKSARDTDDSPQPERDDRPAGEQ